MMFITISARDSLDKLEGKTENMCVGTKKRGSMTAVVLMDSSHSESGTSRVAEWRESTKKFGESCS